MALRFWACGLLAVGVLACSKQEPRGAVAAVGSAQEAVSPADGDQAAVQFYTAKVQPIFRANCYKCHGGTAHKGGFYMGSRAGMMKGGHDGPVVVPGDAADSLLVRLIRHQGPTLDPMPMPPKSKLSDTDIATVTQWVQAGAAMPPDEPR